MSVPSVPSIPTEFNECTECVLALLRVQAAKRHFDMIFGDFLRIIGFKNVFTVELTRKRNSGTLWCALGGLGTESENVQFTIKQSKNICM